MTPNLPPHLQERHNLIVKSYNAPVLETEEFTGDPIFRYKQIDAAVSYGYQQAYSDLIAELGPVVETLRLIAAIHCDYRVFDSETHERLVECIVADTDAAREALKHLKERIFNEPR